MQSVGPNAKALFTLARRTCGMFLMSSAVFLLPPLPSSVAEEVATQESLADAYMVYASSQLCMRDFSTFEQKQLDRLASETKHLEDALDLSAEEMQQVQAESKSVAAALYSLATPQNQRQQCEQLRKLVEVYMQGRKFPDSF